METKKKKRSIANEEPVQNKKEKKKNDDQETLTKHKKRKHLIEESAPCAEEYTVEIPNKKKKKKESKVKEEVGVETVPCAEDNDLSIDNEGCKQLEPKDEILYKPDKSKKKKTKDKKVVLLAEVDDNEDLQRLCPEKISTKKNKTKQSTAEEIVHQLEALSETIVSGTGDAHEKRKKKKKKQPKRVSVEEVHINLETNDETSCNAENSKKKNKKKRSKDKSIDPQAQTNLEPDDETSCQPENLKKKKKKKKIDLLEAQVEDNEGLQTLSAEKISTKKKKAKQSMAEQSAHQLPALSKTVVSVTEDVHKEESKKTKKKKKKKQHEDAEKIQPAVPETEMENGECELDDHNLASINNKKKKKKRAHQAHDNITINNGTLSNKDTQDCGKSTIFNNMKRHMLDGTISNEIPKSKKKKNIKFKQEGGSEATECGGDVEVVSVKKGNIDEVEIDKNYGPLFVTLGHNAIPAQHIDLSRQLTQQVNVLGLKNRAVQDTKDRIKKNTSVVQQIQSVRHPHQQLEALAPEELHILPQQLEGILPDAETPLAGGEHDVIMLGPSPRSREGHPIRCQETVAQHGPSDEDDTPVSGSSTSSTEGSPARCLEKVTHHRPSEQPLFSSSDQDETPISPNLLPTVALPTACEQPTARPLLQRILSPPSPTEDSEPVLLVPDTEEISIPSTLEEEQERLPQPSAEFQPLSSAFQHVHSRQPELISQSDQKGHDRCLMTQAEREEAWNEKFRQQQETHQTSLDSISSNIAHIATHMSNVETKIKKLCTDREQQYQSLLSAVQYYFQKMQDNYKEDCAARRCYEADSLQVARDTQRHIVQLASSAMAIASSLCVRARDQLGSVSPASQGPASQQLLSMVLADLPKHSRDEQGNGDAAQVHQGDIPFAAQPLSSDDGEDDDLPDNQDLLD